MKKKSLVVAMAITLICATLLCGCGKGSYDFAAQDLTQYVTLPSDLTTRDYTQGLTLKAEPTDADIDKKIEELLKDKAEVVDAGADAKVEDGDELVIDFTGKINGEEFDGGSATDYKHTINIEKTTMIDGFDKGIVGMAKDETKDLNLKFPDNYSKSDLAGKDVVFTIKVKSIKRKQLPEVNDEYVANNPKIFGEEYKTVAEYRAHVLEDLKKEYETENKKDIINAAWQYALENSTIVKYPDGLKDEYTKTILEYYEHTVAAAKELHLKEYVKKEGYTSIDAFKTAVVIPEAEKTLKEQLVLYAAAQAVSVKITDEDATASAKAFYEDNIKPLLSFYSAYYGITDYNSFIKQYTLDFFKDGLVFDKAFEKITNTGAAEA